MNELDPQASLRGGGSGGAFALRCMLFFSASVCRRDSGNSIGENRELSEAQVEYAVVGCCGGAEDLWGVEGI